MCEYTTGNNVFAVFASVYSSFFSWNTFIIQQIECFEINM